MGDSERWSNYETASSKKKIVEKENGGVESQENLKSIPFQWNQFQRRLLFGAMVGFSTGGTFGMIEVYRKTPSTSSLFSHSGLHSLVRGGVTTGAMFAGFFTLYNGTKYSLERYRGTDDLVNVGIAGAVGCSPFIRSLPFRQSFPYVALLVALDYFHEELRPRK